MIKSYKLVIGGYWGDESKEFLPEKGGAYFVYIAAKDVNRVILDQIIYIGEADNINLRIADHEKYTKWQDYLMETNELFYSAVKVSTDRNLVAAAYINQLKPAMNIAY